jgi:ubiquinone/menaquinone biosynthesis C-methylase UbiE
MSRANLNKDPEEVAAMFDGVAKRYDLVNDLLSLGRTKAWRKAATRIIAPKPGMVILDLAAGPGSSSEPLFKAGATVFATDFSEGMLAQGRKARPYLNFSKADALNLPFEADTFDVVTISYGLRNTADFDKALAEARRVTKPGGRMVVVEFSHPTWSPFSHHLYGVPDAPTAGYRQKDFLKPGCLCLSSRIDSRLARSSWISSPDGKSRMGRCHVEEPYFWGCCSSQRD